MTYDPSIRMPLFTSLQSYVIGIIETGYNQRYPGYRKEIYGRRYTGRSRTTHENTFLEKK